MSPHWTFLINLLVTWYLVGLIWMVQMVHYKLFDRVGEAGFIKYEADHCNLISLIVGPPMLIEIATATMLLLAAPSGVPRWAVVTGFVAVLAIWLSTAMIQVPCHNRLAAGFNTKDYALLVGSNWIRTALWSGRGVLMAYYAKGLMAA